MSTSREYEPDDEFKLLAPFLRLYLSRKVQRPKFSWRVIFELHEIARNLIALDRDALNLTFVDADHVGHCFNAISFHWYPVQLVKGKSQQGNRSIISGVGPYNQIRGFKLTKILTIVGIMGTGGNSIMCMKEKHRLNLRQKSQIIWMFFGLRYQGQQAICFLWSACPIYC